MNLILYTLLIGILIGILVAAPMGPVGILILRDTLHRGRFNGFLMGIGASVSDTIYGLIAYLGVGLVLNFIEENDLVIRFVGSCVMLAFSYYLYRTPVKQTLNSNQEKKLDEQTGWHKIVTAFIITVSNPLIVFFFLALYSRFNFVFDGKGYLLHLIIAMAAIAAGGILWWTLFTWLIARLRKHFTISGIKWINRIVAIIFTLIGLVGLVNCLIMIVGE